MQKSVVTFLLFFLLGFVCAQVSVQPSNGRTAEELVNSILVGEGVSVSNVTFNNSAAVLNATSGAQLGTFTNNLTGFPGLTFSEGLIIATGDVSVAVGPNDDEGASESVYNSVVCNELDALVGYLELYYPAVLEFDFMTTADMVSFNYVFASEEYPEFVDMGYNDVFGFFVTDLTTNQTTNVALVPNTNMPVTIDNVNDHSYAQYYHELAYYSTWMQYDAYVGPFSATFAVVPCRTYHIKLAISNVGDDAYDSAVFLQGQSFSANAMEAQLIYDREDLPVVVQDCNSCTVTFSQPEAQNQDVVIPLTYSGTAVNGEDITLLPSSVTIPAGQTSVNLVVTAIGDYTPDTLTLNIYYESNVCDEGVTIPILICKNEGIEITSEDVIVCNPVDTISVSVVSGVCGDIQWDPADLLTNPNSLSTGFISNPTEPTQFTVTVFDRFHCTTSTTSFLYGFGEPTYDTINASICQGQVYDKNGFNQTEAGTYVNNSQTSFGCDSITTLNLTVYDPQVSIEIGSTDLCEDGYLELTAVMSGESIRWSNGKQTDVITITTPGTYVATVTEAQCTATDIVNIAPCPDADIYVPNAITPSDLNGINDVFRISIPESIEIETFEIRIFDRWGVLVFQSEEPVFSWDGTINGKLLTNTTYVYYINLKSKWHKAKSYKGIVTVF